MIWTILAVLVSSGLAAPSQKIRLNQDGSYRFAFDTGKDGAYHSRSEVRGQDGVVVGHYSYEDPYGDIRKVHYRADDKGYVATGDVGVEVTSKVIRPQQDLSPQASSPLDNPDSAEPEFRHEDLDGEESGLTGDSAEDDAHADDPPEAFPSGYFLHHFHGLRRLPEPHAPDATPTPQPPNSPPAQQDTTDAPSHSTAGTPTEEATSTVNETSPDGEEPDAAKNEVTTGQLHPAPQDDHLNQIDPFLSLAHFRSVSPRHWATSMFRRPVYLLAYQQPESYGYSYHF